MKGSETKLLKFMEGDDKRFVIPVYQRNYDWKVENCRQLFDDLIKVNRHQTKSHFFGSIVSVYNPEVITEEYQIIDGQQRLTTVSLLLLAICNLIRSGKIQTDQENLEKMIYEKFLVDKWKNKGSDIKLQPVKSDRQAYYQLFDEMEEEHFKWSNVTINYNYFCERISQGEISLIDLYRSIQKLEIINIKLSPEDNPQLIFESLNSTGLALTELLFTPLSGIDEFLFLKNHRKSYTFQFSFFAPFSSFLSGKSFPFSDVLPLYLKAPFFCF